jgi:uncharacterized Rmd1/YagE family protein
MNKNRFAGLKDVKTLQELEATPVPEKSVKMPQKSSKSQEATTQTEVETPRRGRPNGKRTNKDFRQVTAYIRTETYKRTKMKLFAADKPKEFSVLVDDLLKRWLKGD